MTTGVSDELRFERDIRSLFRDVDVDGMAWLFDLTDHAQVAEHADSIVMQLEIGSMPCDGPWDEERVALFKRWVAGGCPA